MLQLLRHQKPWLECADPVHFGDLATVVAAPRLRGHDQQDGSPSLSYRSTGKSEWDTGCPSWDQVLFGFVPRDGCQVELLPGPISRSALPRLDLYHGTSCRKRRGWPAGATSPAIVFPAMLLHTMFLHPFGVTKYRRAALAVLRIQRQAAVEAELDTEVRDGAAGYEGGAQACRSASLGVRGQRTLSVINSYTKLLYRGVQ